MAPTQLRSVAPPAPVVSEAPGVTLWEWEQRNWGSRVRQPCATGLQ